MNNTPEHPEIEALRARIEQVNDNMRRFWDSLRNLDQVIGTEPSAQPDRTPAAPSGRAPVIRTADTIDELREMLDSARDWWKAMLVWENGEQFAQMTENAVGLGADRIWVIGDLRDSGTPAVLHSRLADRFVGDYSGPWALVCPVPSMTVQAGLELARLHLETRSLPAAEKATGRNGALVERDKATVALEALRLSYGRALAERDAALAERDAARAERDQAVHELLIVRVELATVQLSLDEAERERDEARAVALGYRRERDEALADSDKALASRDEALAVRERLERECRDARRAKLGAAETAEIEENTTRE